MAESVVYSEVKYKKESNADTGRAGPQIKVSPEDDVVYAAVVHKADHTNGPDPLKLPTPADSSPKGSKGIRRHSLLLLAVVVLCILILGTVISLSLYYYSQNTKTNAASKQHTTQDNGHTTQSTTHSTSEKNKHTNPTAGCKPGKCNDGWEAHGRQCYFFSTKKKSLNWTQSQEECVHKKSHLAIINDKKEQKLLMMIIRQKMQGPEDKFWIGLNDRQMEGKWLWVDNTPLNTSQKFWLNNEPDNWKWVNNTEYPDGEDCVRMGENNFIANSAAGWVDTACEREFKFICETKACL
ncbi:C-type lectin domain family 6 member A-like isoform X2 [Alosa sapidissima]|uniref:C-type lectin domain family 6 member A-like isoform X2 n=1 Tax=Alosa sapidissima TaxID=34773 RepID=UPI001C083034|nr:C-type lectin domain family 6 member A-like isoform X2 [Alosa sapidissima]